MTASPIPSRAALMDVLEGRQLSRSESLVLHLQRLLNARAGVLPHMEDYGLPDVAGLFQGLPHSLNEWTMQVRRTILRFEPRIQSHGLQIQAEPFDARKGEQRIRLTLRARLADGEAVRLAAVFDGDGAVTVSRQGQMT